MADKIVDIRDAFWKRDDRMILENVSWSINKGENWAVLGLNGSGKTSLLNLAMGYQYPTKGKASVLGNEYGKTNVQNVRKMIGFISSSLDRFSSSFEFLTALEVVVSGKFASFGLFEHVDKEDWERAKILLKAFRMEQHYISTYHTLSQGEQKRVMIARAFMAEPKLLILDEPCNGLDIRSREDLLSSLQEKMEQESVSVIYVTHHIEEILPFISHVLLMKDGKVLASGEKEKILTSDMLSKAFSVPVDLDWNSGRPWLHVLNK